MESQGQPEDLPGSTDKDPATTGVASSGTHVQRSSSPSWCVAILFLFVFVLSLLSSEASVEPVFNVQNYVVNGGAALSSNTVNSILSRHTGTNISLAELVSAASDLRSAYGQAGYTNLSVAIAQDRITNGVVTINLFRGLVPQILISGKRYTNVTDQLALTRPPNAMLGAQGQPKTNAPPGFPVRAYEITGDTLLTTNTLMSIFAKRTGTNVTINDILQAASDLQMEYRYRGFPTVVVSVPQQTITNGMVKIRVFQGRISDIQVANNHYFSSNNVMRSLPSLHTNIILSGPVFQAEVDRANANQDRQISAELQPGPVPNTTELVLKVKDRLPLHAKIELSNQSSPGTPELRLNSSASYNNLWQLEHSVGVQYSFSPEMYKSASDWEFYDRPLVANYSGFYRLPLGDIEPVEDFITAQPANFGYDEATRKFRLPPSSGRPELNFFASRSTIDTGLEDTAAETLLHTSSRTITKFNEQEDLTRNEGVGFRLSEPLPQVLGIQSLFSGGFDYKHYDVVSTKTYIYKFIEILHHTPGDAGYTQIGTLASPVPATERMVHYAPLTLRLDSNRRDTNGVFSFGVGYSANFLGEVFKDNQPNFHNVAGSARASGYYQIVTASLSRDQVLFRSSGNTPNAPPQEWRLSLRLDGQWANQPLISNEQFGVGGLSGVRGYREGEVFGDTGWRVTSEFKAPPKIVGVVYGNTPLIVRPSVYMDYAEAYLLDPNGRNGRVPLWGVGFGAAASVGSHWEGRLLFSWPLLNTIFTERNQPRFDFGLSFQF